MNWIYAEEFYKIKQACIEVRKILGNGLMEKVYENALAYELMQAGYQIETQKKLTVLYKGQIVGDYFADIVFENKIIIEMKAVEEILDIHKAQLLNYLVITGYKLGVLVNFPNNKHGVEVERFANTK
ncbi:MAG: GxxExxY protein [Candidatus Stygibacter australis]|nr:GxxExxY protein [Candidatus Stygibacter australis]